MKIYNKCKCGKKIPLGKKECDACKRNRIEKAKKRVTFTSSIAIAVVGIKKVIKFITTKKM